MLPANSQFDQLSDVNAISSALLLGQIMVECKSGMVGGERLISQKRRPTPRGDNQPQYFHSTYLLHLMKGSVDFICTLLTKSSLTSVYRYSLGGSV